MGRSFLLVVPFKNDTAGKAAAVSLCLAPANQMEGSTNHVRCALDPTPSSLRVHGAPEATSAPKTLELWSFFQSEPHPVHSSNSNKDATIGAPGIATRNKGLTTSNKKPLETRASLLVTSALLVVTRSY